VVGTATGSMHVRFNLKPASEFVRTLLSLVQGPSWLYPLLNSRAPSRLENAMHAATSLLRLGLGVVRHKGNRFKFTASVLVERSTALQSAQVRERTRRRGW
jgi:hypothetical protein